MTRKTNNAGANTKNSKNKDDDIIFVDNTIASGAPLAARSYLELSEDSSDEPLSSPTKKMSTRKRRSKLSPQSTLGDTDLSFLTDDESEIVSRNDDDDDSYTESRRPKKSKRTPKARTPRSPRKLTKTRSKSSRSRSSRRNRYYDSTSSEPEEEEENYLEDDDYMESSDNYNEASSNPNNDSVTPRNDNVPNSDDDSSVNVSVPTPIPQEEEPEQLGSAVDLLLAKVSNPIKEWISICKAINTRYVAEGTRLNIHRWDNIPEDQLSKEVDMYLVKWRGLSYLHCSWEFEEDLMAFEKQTMKQKILRFQRNQEKNYFDTNVYGNNVYFNPDFIQVDYVLDVRPLPSAIETDNNSTDDVEMNEPSTTLPASETDKNDDPNLKEYLVKWVNLQYCDSTWELYEDFGDDEAVKDFEKRQLRTLPEDVHEPKYRPPIQDLRKISKETVYENGNQLRVYQEEGVNWLLFNWFNRRNSILADEMGLGKTAQTTIFIYTLLRTYHMTPPFLVVAPLSTIPHWEREIRQWTDLHVVVLHGNSASRTLLKKYEWTTERGNFDILLTTYEIVLTEAEQLASIEWTGLIVDEAHRLKGKKSKLSEMLRSMKFGCKVLLTGTPLQNNTEELFTLLNFLQPEAFPELDEYMELYGDLKDAKHLDNLHKALKPFLLRRMKDDVEKSLKPKEETLINVELTSIQKKFYRAIYDRNTSVFLSGDYHNLPSMMNIMMQLRKCCNHPFLIQGIEETVLHENKIDPASPTYDQDMLNLLISSSGKMVLLDKLLPKLQSQGHRVLLFSQMVRMLDIIQDYLNSKGYIHERIDGGMKVCDRKAALDRFCAPNSDRFIFLICTRAGGLGINLTAADTVIIFDSDWNPQNDLQAEARCHRIGQEKSVKIYRLVTNRTYEQDMFKRANLKLGLDKAVLNPLKRHVKTDGETSDFSHMSKAEAEALLKYGAYDFFKDEREGKIDERSKAFCEADIDQILENNSKVILVDHEGGSSFSKASFVTNTSDEVDINDPNFWVKYVGLKDTTLEPIGPRNRKKPEYVDKIEDDGENAEDLTLEDENEWTKTERDFLLKALSTFGWGQWNTICNLKRLMNHPKSTIQILSACIIGQFARALKALEDNPQEAFVSKRTSGTASKSALQARDALEYYKDKYEICQVIIEEDLASSDEGSTTLPYPTQFPLLVRDGAFWNKILKIADRYLKHWSFLVRFHRVIDECHLTLETTQYLPSPRRAVLPASWWDRKDDLNLFKGVMKHGWNSWVDIYSDPVLGFISKGVQLPANATANNGNEDEAEETPVDDEDLPLTLPSSPTSESVKIWPIPGLLMRRVRRLVSALETQVKKQKVIGIDHITKYINTTSIYENGPTTKKGKSNTAKNIVNGSYIREKWSKNELKALRAEVLRWGLPLPPEDPYLNPENPDYTLNYEHRCENVPLNEDVLEVEHDYAEIQTTLSLLIQGVQVTVPEPTLTEEELQRYSNPKTKLPSLYSPTYIFQRCPIFPSDTTTQGLYSDSLGPWEFLRVQAKLKQKTAAMVQEMCRKMEVEMRNKIAEGGHTENNEGEEMNTEEGETKEIKDRKADQDTKDSGNELIPNELFAKRLAKRLDIFYALQAHVWTKDEPVIRYIIQKWADDNHRRQEHLPVGWVPEVHDVALLKAIHRRGMIDWELIWSDPESPFRPIPKETLKGKKEEESSYPPSPVKREMADREENEEDMSRNEEEDHKDLSHALGIQKDPSYPTGLISLNAHKRLQWLIEAIATYDIPKAEFTYNPVEPPRKSTMVVHENPRHVVVNVHNHRTRLPATIVVRETYEVSIVPAPHVTTTVYASSAPVKCKIGGEFQKIFYQWSSGNTDSYLKKIENYQKTLAIHQMAETVGSELHDLEMSSSPAAIINKHIELTEQEQRDLKLYNEVDHELLASHLCSRHLYDLMPCPFRVKGVTILKFGRIMTEYPTYHSDSYIWPVGFMSQKDYNSYLDPSKRITYTSEILEYNKTGPKFRVTAEDDAQHPIDGNSATSVWSRVLQRVKKQKLLQGLGKSGTAVSGPEYFGYAIPEVAAVIEGLEGALECSKYVFRIKRKESRRKHTTAPLMGDKFYGKRQKKEEDIEEDEIINNEESSPMTHHLQRASAKKATEQWKNYSIQVSDDDENYIEEEEDDEDDYDSDHYHLKKQYKRKVPKVPVPEVPVVPKVETTEPGAPTPESAVPSAVSQMVRMPEASEPSDSNKLSLKRVNFNSIQTDIKRYF